MSEQPLCPFCGKPLEWNEYHGCYRCENYDCMVDVHSSSESSKKNQLQALNTRPLEDALKARISVLEAELSRQSELLRRWMIAFDNEIVIITDQEMTIEIGREFGNLVAETKKELYQIAKKAESALKGEVQK